MAQPNFEILTKGFLAKIPNLPQIQLRETLLEMNSDDVNNNIGGLEQRLTRRINARFDSNLFRILSSP